MRDETGESHRHLHQEGFRLAARFNQDDARIRVFAETAGDDGTGTARSDHDVIGLIHGLFS